MLLRVERERVGVAFFELLPDDVQLLFYGGGDLLLVDGQDVDDGGVVRELEGRVG